MRRSLRCGVASQTRLLLVLGLITSSCLGQVPSTYFEGLHVSGNQLVNAQGTAVRLQIGLDVRQGVNRSGMEYACVQGWGFADGPMDLASIQAMLTWGINSVRLPLNEGCWQGQSVQNQYSGSAYRQQVTDYVNLVTGQGMAIILDLHFAAPGSQSPSGLLAMPNTDHTPAFWTDVANTFKGNSRVIFDLYNEPYPLFPPWSSDDGWLCWKNGGNCNNSLSYTAAGLPSLLTAVRSTGATNVVLMGGLAYSNNLDHWLDNIPIDPAGNLAASIHIYDFTECSTTQCWDQYVLPVASQVPVVLGEFGQQNCGGTFVPMILDYFHQHGMSYLGWTWDIWPGMCGSGPTLITDYNGTPTASGQQFKDFLSGHPAATTGATGGQVTAATTGATTGGATTGQVTGATTGGATNGGATTGGATTGGATTGRGATTGANSAATAPYISQALALAAICLVLFASIEM